MRWSVEAKVLKSPKDTARYLRDLEKYLEGKGSPLATEGALGGYLITGKPEEFLSALQTELKVKLKHSPAFPSRPHRTSEHMRNKKKLPGATPPEFLCHHMPFSFN